MAIENKKRIGLLLAGGGAVLLIVIIYVGHFARITTPRFCEICHMLLYDKTEYGLNYGVLEMKQISAPRGLLVGCAECHRNPYREYKNSDHSKTDMDMRPGCPNCHTPHGLFTAARYMFTTSPYLGVTDGMMMDSARWESEERPKLAMKVREGFLKNSSRPCRQCHDDMDAGLEPHQIAEKEKMDCIECHFNLVHKETPWPEKEEKKEKLGL